MNSKGAPIVAVAVAAILLLCFSTSVDATSSGLLTNCDLTPQNISGWYWANGYFGQNNTYGRYYNYASNQKNPYRMPWAWWPRPSTYYTFRTSDDATPADDPTTYTPGRWTELHIRVQDIMRKYIGITLYASNGTTNNYHNVVGSWSFPPGAPFQVRTGTAAAGTSCTVNYGSTLTHINADPKLLHTRFFFTAPVGTGKVTIKILLKEGEQNKGNFWYLPQDFTLNEGPAVVNPVLPGGTTSSGEPALKTDKAFQTVVGAAGQACANVCLKQTPATPYCHSAKTLAVNSFSALSSALAGIFLCRPPALAGCQYQGAAFVKSDDTCVYRSTDINVCPKMYVSANPKPAVPDVCFTEAAATNRPVCVCSNDKTAQPVNPYQTAPRRRLLSYGQSFSEDQPTASSASRFGLSSMIVALIALLSTMMSKSRGLTVFMIACLVVLALAQPADAHNYIKGLHRARTASVSVPCQQRIGNQPHVQVVRNQTFEVEWSLGHADIGTGFRDFWFAVVAESDYDKLAVDNITSIIKNYLDLSFTETGVNSSIIPAGWNKVHMHNLKENLYSFGNISQYFNDSSRGLIGWNITEKDPAFVPRDPIYMKYAHPSSYRIAGQQVESKYLPEFTAADQRAEYKSAKYPWLLAAAHFHNYMIESFIVVDQSDLARFRIPSFAGTGNHIVYFNWVGYKDCIDINVLPGTTPVVQRYGNENFTSTVNTVKVDHCEFNYIPSMLTPCRKLDRISFDTSQCVADCAAHAKQHMNDNTGCMGVQVVRMTNPAGTLPYTPNIPWWYYNSPVGAPECQAFTVHERKLAGCGLASTKSYPQLFCNATTLGLQDDDYICFGVFPLRNQDMQVLEDWSIAKEREEPSYYSTCLLLDFDRNFTGITPAKAPPPDWHTAESQTCLSCGFHANALTLNGTQTPNWGLVATSLTDICTNCDQVESTAAIATWDTAFAGKDLALAGRIDAQQPVTSSSSSTAASTGTSTGTSTGASSTSTSSTAASSTSTSSTGTSSTSRSSTVVSSSSTAVASSSSSSSTGNVASSSSSSTGSTAGQDAVQITIRLNVDWNTADSDAFKSNFMNQVSKALGILASRVTIAAMRLVDPANKRAAAKAANRRLLQTSAVDIDFLILPSDDSSQATPSAAAQSFTTQLSQPSSSLMMSDIGALIDKTVAPQQVNVGQCSNSAYVTPCPATGDDNTNDGSDPGSSSSGLSSMTLGLIIVGAIVGIAVLGAILFFVIKSCAAKSASNKQIQQLAMDSHMHRASTA